MVHLTFKVKANKDETFKDVIYKFKMNECPKDLKRRHCRLRRFLVQG